MYRGRLRLRLALLRYVWDNFFSMQFKLHVRSLIAGLADTVDVGRGDGGTDGAGVGTFEPPAVPQRVVDKWWIPDG